MDGIIRAIGLCLRLPCYIIAMIFVILYWILGVIVGAFWYFVVEEVVWLIIGIPGAFLSVSFRGSGKAQLQERVREHRDRLRRRRTGWFEACSRPIGKLNRWLVEGSR